MLSRRIRHLIVRLMLLRAVASVEAAETRLPFDSRSLVEVQRLDVVPKEILDLLGWHRDGSDGIAERFDQFNATGSAESKLPNRLFETAGVSSAAAVLIYRQAGRPPTFHSVAFMMTPAGWSRVGEWTLDEDTRSLRYFLYRVDSVRYRQAQWYFSEQRRFHVEQRISQTRPAPRNSPLRKANLSDDEAREIQSVMASTYPGAILNISGVVSGCPCEDGASCTNQVWVVPQNDLKTGGTLLSQIGGRWTLGPIQKWWLDKAKMEGDQRMSRNQRAEALDSLWEAFPACAPGGAQSAVR